MKLKKGDKVKVCWGSGLLSNCRGTIVDRSEVRTRGDGVPLIEGHYKPVDWSREVAIRFEDGSIGTMFKSRLIKMED